MRSKFSFRDARINSKFVKYFVVFVVMVAVGLFVKNVLTLGDSINQTDSKLVLKSATASKPVQKEVEIALIGEKGEEVDAVTMRIENVELRDEIIVQGQKASSVAGRSFLVVNLKLTNKLQQGVEVNTKDYLRLGVLGQEEAEWFAPDIHNDPVLIQAISTKPTRVAFPVNEGEKKYVLQVGEIAKEKERIEIDLSY